MPDPDLKLSADFFVKTESDDWTPPDAVERLVRDHFPDALLSSEIGREHVQANIDRLKAMGCPPLLLKSSEHVLDKTLHLSIPIEGYASRLSGDTAGFSFYDGCMSLDCEPFDIDALKWGAKAIARKLDLNFEFRFGSVGDLNIEIYPTRLDMVPAMNRRFEGHSFGPPQTEPILDWQSSLRTAVCKWLDKHPDKNLVARWSAVTTPIALAAKLIQRLESIAVVMDCERGHFGQGNWHDNLVIGYSDWTAIVNLPGVSERLFAEG